MVHLFEGHVGEGVIRVHAPVSCQGHDDGGEPLKPAKTTNLGKSRLHIVVGLLDQGS